MILKELVFDSFYIGQVYGGLQRSGFLIISTLGGCGGLEKCICSSFYFRQVVVVLKDTDL